MILLIIIATMTGIQSSWTFSHLFLIAVEDSVDFAQEFNSSVTIGEHSFAQMGDDVDKKKLSEPSKASMAAAALLNRQTNEEFLTIELQRKNKYERLLRKAQNEDFSEFSNLRAVYQSGVDKFGRPIIIVVGRMIKTNEIDFDKVIHVSAMNDVVDVTFA